MARLPMFPLGSVLFPTMVLPLHVFEPRYRQLMDDCLAEDGPYDREFGVCLIERGFEVGGGDVRSEVGTVAQIVDAQQFEDGRWAVAAVGTRRIRVTGWLEDDPYPVAEVEDWLDQPTDEDLTIVRDTAEDRLRAILQIQADLGLQAPPVDTAIDADPTLASYQIATLSPLGSFDRQRILGTESTGDRLDLLAQLLDEALGDLRASRDMG